MERRQKLELTPEEQDAEARDAAFMAAARAMNPSPTTPFAEMFPTAVEVPELIYWAGIGRLFKVKVALNNGAELDQIGPFGASALHDAAANGHLAVVQLLVGQGADVGLRTPDNQLAVDLAREAKHADVVAYLESLSADAEPVGAPEASAP